MRESLRLSELEAAAQNIVIRIDENTVAMWAVHFIRADDHGRSDLLAHLGRNADGTYTLIARLRHYVNDKVFDSKDHKTWYRVHDGASTTDLRAVERFRRVVETFSETVGVLGSSPPQYWELLRGARTIMEFGELLASMPGMHVSRQGVPS